MSSGGKKLINAVSDCVDDALNGLVRTAPNDLILIKEERIIARKQIPTNQVSIVTGGGSGHEPFAAGYVGSGCLTGAVAGLVFASPPADAVDKMIQHVKSDAGTIVLVINYTGDRINFGLAAERRKKNGEDVTVFIIDDDCATLDGGTGRRGLCGSLFLFKMSGAMSNLGKDKSSILTMLETAKANISTFGIALTPCSLPGSKANFSLADDEMELGLGVHGENGIGRAKLCTAREAVSKILDRLLDERYSRLRLKAGDSVAVIINNLGGMSKIEELIVGREVVDQMESRSLKVMRVYCGALMTSLEMAGVQVSILKLVDPKWVEYLNAPSDAPAWPNGGLVREYKDIVLTSQSEREVSTKISAGKADEGKRNSVKGILGALCNKMIGLEAELNRLDAGSGDGDCGSTMAYGAKSVINALDSFALDSPTEFLDELGRVLGKMGGTSGGIYSLFLTAASAAFQDPSKCWDNKTWISALGLGCEAVMKYGGAKLGDRTLVDALLPAFETAKAVTDPNSMGGADLAKLAADAAAAGAESTAEMKEAAMGRASYVDKARLVDCDPGAKAVAAWMAELERALRAK